MHRRDLIENISRDFIEKNTNDVIYAGFINALDIEMVKLRLLEQFYWKIKEQMDFRGTHNLYDMLTMFDEGRDKRFRRDEVEKIFRSKGFSMNEMEIQCLFDEYDPRKLGYIDYIEFEKDYSDFLVWFHENRRTTQINIQFNMPQILRIIKDYCERHG
jgi:Ca2+-binding EF-hand superfamily protein